MKVFNILLVAVFASLISLQGQALDEESLVLVGASYGKNVIAICDREGRVLWKFDTEGPEKGHAGHHDIQMLDNGHLLFHDSWTKIKEMDLEGKIVWTYDSRKENGNRAVDVHAFKRLPNGETVIVESGVGRVIHVDRDGKITREFPLGEGGRKNTRLMTVTAPGTYLVCAENPGVVTEYDSQGSIAWEYEVKTRVFGALRLNNGNTLICTGNGNRVIEVSPNMEIIWEISKSVPETEIQLGWMTDLQELPNGNLVLGNCHAGEKNPQIFEITRDKKVVWTFQQWSLVGNGLACWEILTPEQSRRVREKLATLPRD